MFTLNDAVRSSLYGALYHSAFVLRCTGEWPSRARNSSIGILFILSISVSVLMASSPVL